MISKMPQDGSDGGWTGSLKTCPREPSSMPLRYGTLDGLDGFTARYRVGREKGSASNATALNAWACPTRPRTSTSSRELPSMEKSKANYGARLVKLVGAVIPQP